MKIIFRTSFKLLICILSFQFTEAQSLLPFIENFTKINYRGDNQIWSITQAKDSTIFFANNHFLLRFDGSKWEKYKLPNNTVIRSTYFEKDKLFTGSYSEFGFWIRKNGKMKYFSLSKNLFNQKNNEEIWKIFSFKNKIYFQTFTQLYCYDKNKITKINLPEFVSYCFPIKNKLFVMGVNNGIYIYDNKVFKKISDDKILNNKVIHAIKKIGNEYWIFTYKQGVFIINNSKITSWNNPLNENLKETRINAVTTNKNMLLIGTANDGIILFDLKTQKTQKINHSNGLLNNSILCFYNDFEGNIWAGLDNGIVRIELNSPVSMFNDYSGKLGSVYSISDYKNGYLLASNLGTFNLYDNKLEQIENSKGQNWEITKINNQLIIGHNEGTFIIDENNFYKLNDIHGGWKFIHFYDKYYIQATYSGINIYKIENNKISWIKQIKGFLNPISDAYPQTKNIIWAVDNYKGLFKLTIDDNFNLKKLDNIGAKTKIIKDFNVKILPFKNILLFLSQGKWFEFNELEDSLKPNKIFNQQFLNTQTVIKIDENSFVIYKDEKLYYIIFKNGKFTWNLIPQKYYKGRIINDYLTVKKIKNQLFINLDEGFLSYKINNLKENTNIKIEAYFENKLLDENVKLNNNNSIVLYPIDQNFGFLKKDLYYKINNEKEFLSIKDSKVELNNLNHGKYLISFYIFQNGIMKKINSYKFSIKAPFYLSWWMILIYIFFVILCLFIYYKWNKIRNLQKLNLQKEELKHKQYLNELKIQTENDKKIEQLEKEKLHQQVKNKSSEVAGKALAIVKNAEMIDSIKEILEIESDIIILKQKIAKIIKVNLNQTQELQVFEQNLTETHEVFIHKLTQLFPELTPKDIKLCIYLRMNLTSKEIAPLMNISYRSVELNRYRLRKKMNLPQEENLAKFMLKF